MFRSLLLRRSGVTLERTATIINGDSSSSSSSLLAPTAKYFLFSPQNLISNSRVTNSIFYSFYTTTIACNNRNLHSDSSFVVSYLINSCGLSQNQAITASKKVNFKTTIKPDSVQSLLKTYGFTESHISVMIIKLPSILTSSPHETIKPKLDFFISRGFYGLDLAKFISKDPGILMRSFDRNIIPSFDIIKSVVQSDQNVIRIIRKNCWILTRFNVDRLMVNLELLRNEGVPHTDTISKCLISQPRAFMREADSFKEIVEKVKGMGFSRLQGRFLRAIAVLSALTEANWRKKVDVFKRWGWSEDQIQAAFRKNPYCMTVSEEKIMAIMNFLVDEMKYDSSSVAENPIVFSCSLKERLIPRCSVVRILVSRGLLMENMPISSLAVSVDKYFLEKYVMKYERQIPELMKIFQGQLNYQQILRN